MGFRDIKFICVLAMAGAMVWISPVKSANLPEVESDKGLVVFYRNSKFTGGAVRFNLNHSEGYVGQLLSGIWLYKSVAPGDHAFWSQALSKDSIMIKVEAGKTYYVKGEVKMGVLVGPPFISPGERSGSA